MLPLLHTRTHTQRPVVDTMPMQPGRSMPGVLSAAAVAAPATAAALLVTTDSLHHRHHHPQALAAATGRKEALIKKEYEESGDLGVVAVNARSTQRTMFAPPPLTISGVFKTFKDIASTGGKDSQERKRGLINKLLVASKQNETGYIMRSLQVGTWAGSSWVVLMCWHLSVLACWCDMVMVSRSAGMQEQEQEHSSGSAAAVTLSMIHLLSSCRPHGPPWVINH